MGFYIQVPRPTGKAQQLIDLHGAILGPMKPDTFEEVPPDIAIICVLHNSGFEAALLCTDTETFEEAGDPNDTRVKDWLLMDKSVAHPLAGYTEGKR